VPIPAAGHPAFSRGARPTLHGPPLVTALISLLALRTLRCVRFVETGLNFSSRLEGLGCALNYLRLRQTSSKSRNVDTA